MEVQLKAHTKLKVGEVGVGKTFRSIIQMKAYLVVDLSKSGFDGTAGLVYAVDLSTGVVEAFARETEVYLCPMKSIERDEE